MNLVGVSFFLSSVHWKGLFHQKKVLLGIYALKPVGSERVSLKCLQTTICSTFSVTFQLGQSVNFLCQCALGYQNLLNELLKLHDMILAVT